MPSRQRLRLGEQRLAVLGEHEAGLDRGVRRAGVRRQVGRAVDVQLLEPRRRQREGAAEEPAGRPRPRARAGRRAPRPARPRAACGRRRGRCRCRRGRTRRPWSPAGARPAAGLPRAPSASRCRSAARSTKACWPRLTGTSQPRSSSKSPMMNPSACDVPATSQSRNVSVSGCRAGRNPIRSNRSPSVTTTMHGHVEVVPDRHRCAAQHLVHDQALAGLAERRGHSPAAVDQEPVEQSAPSGWTPLTYVVSATADCDSPIASRHSTSRSGTSPRDRRRPG